MTITSKQRKLVNDKETFLLWVELGTLEKVQNHYNTQGIINPRTEKPLSSQAIWTSAMRWVLENPVEAKEYYDAGEGLPLSQDEWELWLIQRAFMVYNYSKSRTIKWAKHFNLFDKYYHLFAEKFHLPERE